MHPTPSRSASRTEPPRLVDRLRPAAEAVPALIAAAHAMGLSGDKAVLAADRAVAKAYGISLIQVFGLRQRPETSGRPAARVVPLHRGPRS